MGAFEVFKKVITPPVAAEWVDTVVTHRSRKADEIEAKKGPEAADKYREKTGRVVARMMDRGLIPPDV